MDKEKNISSGLDEENAPIEKTEERSDKKPAESPRQPAPAPAPVRKERLSFVAWLATCWPLAVAPPMAVCLWLHYGKDVGKNLSLAAGIAVAFLLNSLFTIWFYKKDKKLAEQGRRRIPEFLLHFWELICGWPGALYAQKKYHHKRSKKTYMIVFWFYVILNLAGLFFLFLPGTTGKIIRYFLHKDDKKTEQTQNAGASQDGEAGNATGSQTTAPDGNGSSAEQTGGTSTPPAPSNN